MAAMKDEIPDGCVEVDPEPSVPQRWKKKMYRMNGRLNQKWVQYYDPQSNRYNTLQSVEGKVMNPKPGKIIKKVFHLQHKASY